MVYIGKVISTDDKYGAGRIYVYIAGLDREENISDEKIAFPFLPKFFYVCPKIGENVVVIAVPSAEGDPMTRLYIGPIISQPQDMSYNDGAKSLVGMGLGNWGFQRNPNLIQGSYGSLAKDNEVAIYSRGLSDILLGDESLRLRCGSKLMGYDVNGKTLQFNSTNSAFMHMKYYDMALHVKKKAWDEDKNVLTTKEATVGSVATISADEINLVTSSAIKRSPINNSGSEMLDDNEIAQVIKDGHPMVYGDKLIEVLNVFREAIYNHVHDWGPSMAKDHPTPQLERLDEVNFGQMLSTNVRVI